MSDSQIIDVLKALADPTRLEIVRKLGACDSHQKSCGDLSAKAGLSQPAMSHHFSRLVDSGVVIDSKHGTEKTYRLNTALLHKLGIDIRKL